MQMNQESIITKSGGPTENRLWAIYGAQEIGRMTLGNGTPHGSRMASGTTGQATGIKMLRWTRIKT